MEINKIFCFTKYFVLLPSTSQQEVRKYIQIKRIYTKDAPSTMLKKYVPIFLVCHTKIPLESIANLVTSFIALLNCVQNRSAKIFYDATFY